MKLLKKIKSCFSFLVQCQSCGLVLSKDENKGGTNRDGSKSIEYCSFCYCNGTFVHSNATKEDILRFLRSRLLLKGMSENMVDYLIHKFQKEMHTYKRWS